jgi:hypothetical protein
MKGNSCDADEVGDRVNPEMVKESAKFGTKPFFTSMLMRMFYCITSVFIV